MRPETLAVHAGRRIDPGTKAVMPPIVLSTTFERDADGSYEHGYVYSRSDNPNRHSLEQCMAELEGGVAAAAFASGQAASMSVLQSLRAGDHVLLPDDVYFGTRNLAQDTLGQWGLQSTIVDMTNLESLKAAIQENTRLIWVETPSNPLLKITDIAKVADIAHEAGAMCLVDNTWMSPIGQRPIDLGADLVMHATTKYLGGHSDVLGGIVVAKQETDFFARMRSVQKNGGAVQAPFDCWLLLRSISSLPYRVRAHTENARQIAEFLSRNPRLVAVHYPGLEQHPGYEIAAKQMLLSGGMMSIQVAGGADEAMEVASRVKLFTRATSLGGVESLIEHRASIEGPDTLTPPNLLRLSIGLEHVDDLIADLEQALA